MAHDNDGKIYVDASSSPRVGIDLLADLQSVFGTNHNDIGHIISDPLILINKWAKYKPIKIGGLDFPRQRNSDFTWKTVQEIEAIPETPWWKGEDGQCGLTFTTYPSLGTNNMSSSSSFFHELLAGNLGWGYVRPTGNINRYPFRFFDFNYYYHSATKPVTGVYDNLRISSNNTLVVQLDQTQGTALSLQLNDFTISNSPVSGWYVGILIWYSNNVGEYMFAFSPDTIGNGNLDVTFTNMAFFGGKRCKVVPFLASQRSNQGVDPGGGIYLSCDVLPEEVLIRGSYQPVDADIDAIWRDALHVRVKWAGNIINNTGTVLTIATLTIRLYENNVAVGQPDTVNNITIPVDGVWSDDGTLVFPYTYDSSNTYTVTMTGTTNTGVNINESVEVNAPRNS